MTVRLGGISGLLVMMAIMTPPAVAAENLIAGSLSREQRESILLEARAAAERGAQRPAQEREAAVADFRIAAKRYEQLITAGVSNGAILYNLGGVSLQAGDLGGAILAYRRAQQLAPRDLRLRKNLSYARSLREDQILASSRRALLERVVEFHRRYPARARGRGFAAAWIALWCVLGIHLVRPSAILRLLAVLLVLTSLAVGGTLGYDQLRPAAEEGVILAEKVVLRKGNGIGYEPMYAEPVHEGTEFTVRERRPGWLEIELADGARGWVPEDAIGTI